MHHVVAYFNTTGGALTLADSPAITDGWATVQNNHFIFPNDMTLLGGMAFADTITRCQLSTPHWRFLGNPELQPLLTIWDDDVAIVSPFFGPRYVTIPQIDEVQALVSTSGAATNGVLVGLFLAPKPLNLNVPVGDVYPVQFTASITRATGGWARGNITFGTSLPAGTFSVVGMDLIDPSSQLARLRFQSYTMLPGIPTRKDVNGTQRDIFRYGRLGNWGQFENTAQPSLEIFSVGGTATTQTGTMDLIKVA